MILSRRIPIGRMRPTQLVVVFLIMVSLLLILRAQDRRSQSPYHFTEGQTRAWGEWNETMSPHVSDQAAYLRFLADRYRLTRDIPWYARRVRVTYRASRRPSMTEVKSRFMPGGAGDFARARLDDEKLPLRVEKAISLPMLRSPRPDELDASALLFGISTTFSRLSYANYSLVGDWARWLTDGRGRSNGATLLLALQGPVLTQLALKWAKELPE